jgi:hypothetical protein
MTPQQVVEAQASVAKVALSEIMIAAAYAGSGS